MVVISWAWWIIGVMGGLVAALVAFDYISKVRSMRAFALALEAQAEEAERQRQRWAQEAMALAAEKEKEQKGE